MSDGWAWRPGVLLLVGLLGLLYGRGWTRAPSQLWRLGVFTSGLILLSFTLLSPLNQLAATHGYLRSAQHLLLAAVIPPLLVIPNPIPTIRLGLPATVRRWCRRHEPPHSPLHRLIRAVTPAGIVYFLFVATFWTWYDSQLYSATVRFPWLRLLEQGSLLLVAMLYWWHIAGVAPRIHAPLPPIPHMLYTLAGAFPIKLVGIVLMFAPTTAYAFDAGATEVYPEQTASGMIIWLLGGVVYSSAAAVFLRRWMSREDDKPLLPHSKWSTEEQMLAPGLEHRRPEGKEVG